MCSLTRARGLARRRCSLVSLINQGSLDLGTADLTLGCLPWCSRPASAAQEVLVKSSTWVSTAVVPFHADTSRCVQKQFRLSEANGSSAQALKVSLPRVPLQSGPAPHLQAAEALVQVCDST